MRGLGIGDDDLAVRVDHHQAVRHGVQRPVEALCDLPRLPVPDDGREQHLADVVGAALDDEHEGHDQQPEHHVRDVQSQDQAGGDRRHEGDGKDHHHARRAVVAAHHGDDRAEGYRNGADLGEGIGIDVDRDEAEQAERQALQAALDDVLALPARRRGGIVDDAFPVEAAHAQIAPYAEQQQDPGQRREHRLAVAPEDHEGDEGMARGANEHHMGVVEQRPDKLDIDFDRDGVGSCFAHSQAQGELTLCHIPINKAFSGWAAAKPLNLLTPLPPDRAAQEPASGARSDALSRRPPAPPRRP